MANLMKRAVVLQLRIFSLI